MTEVQYTFKGLNGVYRGTMNDKQLPDGTGVFISNDETMIVNGMWQNGVLIQGEINWNTGENFKGTFYDNGNEKEGTFTLSSGIIFNGTFDEAGNFKHGKMEKLGNDQTGYYEGHFSNGTRNGMGVLYVANTYYEGHWTDDYLQGEGTMTMVNCELREASGIWQNGHLDGLLTYKNGMRCRFVGKIQSFDEGVRAKAVGHGKILTDAFEYEGSFENEHPVGIGKVTDTRSGIELPVFSFDSMSFCIVYPNQYENLIRTGLLKPQSDIDAKNPAFSSRLYAYHFVFKLNSNPDIKLWHPTSLETMIGFKRFCPACRTPYTPAMLQWIENALTSTAATKIQQFVKSNPRTRKRASAATKIQRFFRSRTASTASKGSQGHKGGRKSKSKKKVVRRA